MLPFYQLMENIPGKHQFQLPLWLSAQCQGRDGLSQQSFSYNLVIHFLHTAVIALVTAFSCPGQYTSLSSLIPLYNLPTVLETSLSAPQLPKKANKWTPLPKPPLPAQTRKDVLSLLSLQKEAVKGVWLQGSHRTRVLRLGIWASSSGQLRYNAYYKWGWY